MKMNYKSPYPSVVAYKCDKNFTVRLKAMIERRMKEAGYKPTDEFIASFSDSEDYLFETKSQFSGSEPEGKEAVEFAEFTHNQDDLFIFKSGMWQAYPYTNETPYLTTEQLYKIWKKE